MVTRLARGRDDKRSAERGSALFDQIARLEAYYPTEYTTSVIMS
jgi:hypothetical protein